MRHAEQEVLDFTRIDVLPAADNHIFEPSRDAEITVFVHYAQVARVQEAVFVDDRGGRFGVFVITFHDVVTLAAHLALYADRTLFVRLRVEHFHFDERQRTSYRGSPDFRRVGHPRSGHAGRTLRQSVYADDVLAVHLFHYLLHRFDRAGGSGHDAGT